MSRNFKTMVAVSWLVLSASVLAQGIEKDEELEEELRMATEFGLFLTTWKEQISLPHAPGLIDPGLEAIDPRVLRLQIQSRDALAPSAGKR